MGKKFLVALSFFVLLLPAYDGSAKDYNDPNVVYLTFDDGPEYPYTWDVLSVLDSYDAPATFFVMEPAVREHPSIAQAIVDGGHAIGSHGVTHSRAAFYESPESAVQEMSATRDAIYETTGVWSDLIRVPYGSIPDLTNSMHAAFKEEEFSMWDWNIDSRDWEHEHNPQAIVDEVVRGLQENAYENIASVILLHDVQPQTTEALPGILDYLVENGYELRTLSSDIPSHNFQSRWSAYEPSDEDSDDFSDNEQNSESETESEQERDNGNENNSSENNQDSEGEEGSETNENVDSEGNSSDNNQDSGSEDESSENAQDSKKVNLEDVELAVYPYLAPLRTKELLFSGLSPGADLTDSNTEGFLISAFELEGTTYFGVSDVKAFPHEVSEIDEELRFETTDEIARRNLAVFLYKLTSG